jgi:uncharacterized protein involved in exopolysaccharide biosynthesis
MAELTPAKQETTLRDFLNVVFRRKWIIVGVVALASVLVFYLNARQPVVFESNARILVKRGEESNVLTGSVRYLGWAEEVSSQIEVILSEEVFSGARKIFQDSVRARGLPPHWFFAPGAVRADVVGESNVFLIRYSSFDPGVCKLGCQAMTLSFQEYYRERQTPPALTDFFTEEIIDVRTDLEHWEAKRNKFMNEQNFFGLDEESRFLLSKISTLENDLIDVNRDINEQNMKVDNLERLRNLSGSELEDELAYGDLLQSGVIRNIKFMIQRLDAEREELCHKYTEKHPEIVAIDEQLRQLRADLKQEVENSYRIEKQTLQTFYANRTSLTQEIDRAKSGLEALPDKQMTLNQLDNTIANLRAKYELLLTRQGESEIAMASRPEWEVTILSNASNAYARKTKDYVRLALGPFLSFVVALGLAFFLESLDHSIKNMAEAEEYLKTPVLATISENRK